MAGPEVWLNVISWSKTLFDASKSAIDLVATYHKYREDPETIKEAHHVSMVSTFSSYEIESLEERIENCRKLFAQEGVGEGRVRCLCSVLNQARAANGGELPEIESWLKMDTQLKCLGRSKSLKSVAATG
ncbi:MAG TPA: hypothetical protein VHX36_14575 [Candidatus Acidoferrales bacterium]|jgi:hypothetical protein|nr:hypothetical protein [Candidatus Acidoferrales bacterium]